MKTIENDSLGRERKTFAATLLSVSDEERTNVNGTKYRVAGYEFINARGKLTRASGMIYAGNYQHGMTVGKEYLATVTFTEQGPLVTISHLNANAERPTMEMFLTEAELATAPAGVSTVTGEIAN